MGLLLVQGTRYLVVGAGNVALDLALLNIAVRATHVTSGPLLVLFASASFLAAVMNSYYWNGRWTFRARLLWRFQFAAFIATNAVGLLINGLVVYFVTALPFPLLESSPMLRVNEAKVIAIGITATWNFLAYRCFVFRTM